MIHLITYGNEKYKKTRKELISDAKNLGWFDTTTEYSPETLEPTFRKQFADILKKDRGAGFWIWKVNIITQKLREIKDNDILIYLDAGCIFNANGKKRFDEYIEYLNNSDKGMISFQLPFTEKKYTSSDIFEHFRIDMNSEIANSGQYVGGVLLMKKTPNLIKLISLWQKTLNTNSVLFTNNHSVSQKPYFISNRHDQSVFSIIRKMNDTIVLKDETYFADFESEKAQSCPIWASRRNIDTKVAEVTITKPPPVTNNIKKFNLFSEKKTPKHKHNHGIQMNLNNNTTIQKNNNIVERNNNINHVKFNLNKY